MLKQNHLGIKAQRRHNKFRMRKHAQDVFRLLGYDCDRVNRHADNLKICSCYGCSNRRKLEGITHKERNANKDLEDYINEIQQ